ncbi:hypothetical protein M5689_011248 [Euphorbia peplus]|nr:hypothetical protein M5689_011248 [Euphorbia peplus]
MFFHTHEKLNSKKIAYSIVDANDDPLMKVSSMIMKSFDLGGYDWTSEKSREFTKSVESFKSYEKAKILYVYGALVERFKNGWKVNFDKHDIKNQLLLMKKTEEVKQSGEVLVWQLVWLLIWDCR